MTEYHLRRIEKCTNVNNRHCVIYQDNSSPIQKTAPPPKKKSKLKNPKNKRTKKNQTKLPCVSLILFLCWLTKVCLGCKEDI